MSIYYNGNSVPLGTPTIALPNPSVEFGEGVFTSMRLHNGRLEGYYKHKKRVEDHAKKLGMPPWPAIDDIAVKKFLLANCSLEGTWRVKLLILQSGNIHTPSSDVYIYVAPYTIQPFHSIRLKVLPLSHGPDIDGVKTLCYHMRRYLKSHVQKQGYDDFLGQDGQKRILEASHSNIFWIHEDILYTPDPILGLLEGVFLSSLQEAWKEKGKKVSLLQPTVDGIISTSCVYICNSLSWAVPVEGIDDCIFAINTSQVQALADLVDEMYDRCSLIIT